MWKPIAGICVILCTFALALEPASKPLVSIECHGRLRHGVVAVGGETTGTTISFNRIVYELQLKDEADQKFAKEHHKSPVTATGTLRKVTGTESKVRWIIDVESVSKRDETADSEGSQLTIRGTLQAKAPRQGAPSEFVIEAAGHLWPIEFSSDAKLQANAETLVGQSILLTGSLERDPEKESAPVIVRAQTLEPAAVNPVKN